MKPLLSLLCSALGLGVLSSPAAAAGPIQSVSKLWSTTSTGVVGGGTDFSSEISSFDAVSRSLFVVGGKGIEVLDLSGSVLQSFDTTGMGEVNSIAIYNGIAAVSFANSANKSLDGRLEFFNTNTFKNSGGATAHLGGINVGSVPDMVTWTAGGTKLLVANEGERQAGGAINAAGTVSVVSFNSAAPSNSVETRLGFAAWDGQEATLRSNGVRIQAGLTTSIALEPEYIAVSANGVQAMVTLQEADAVAIVNLQTNTVTDIRSLGKKDYMLAGNQIDPSDQDGPGNTAFINPRSVPVKGLYMPDGIASYSAGGQTFYVMANEGDAAVDDSDVIRFGNNGVTVDASLGPKASLTADGSIDTRLNILRDGATGDGGITNISEIVSLGGRSFSIRDAQGNLVFDSGNDLEARAIDAGLYDEGRSDDKGVEPEGVALLSAYGRTFAAIGLERTTRSAVALYDVTDPTSATFIGWAETGAGSADRRVEGLSFFEDNGKIYLLVSNEGIANDNIAGDFTTLGTTVLYEVAVVPEPSTYALMAAGLFALGAAVRRRRDKHAAAH